VSRPRLSRIGSGGRNILFLLGFPRLTCQARLAGVYRYAADRGMCVRVVENAYSRPDLGEIVDFWRPAGLIVSCGYGTGNRDVRRLTELPIVYYDDFCGKGRSVSVRSDSRQIGRLAAEELQRREIRQAAFVPYFRDFAWSQERGQAFGEAMAAAGIPVATFSRARRRSAVARVRALADWLARLPLPCGVFAANDMVAEEVEVAAERAGLRIPDDLSLVGVDNQEQLCCNVPVPLTSIQMDFEQGGYLAAEKLDGLIRGTCPAGAVFQYPVLRTVRRASTRTTPTPAGAFVDRMTAFVHEHLEDGVSVERVVKASGYSRRQAEKLFREGAGKSVLTVIHDAVFDRACVLAKDPQFPVSAVADTLGGISRSQLDRIFVARTGLTLRQWLARDGKRECANRKN